MQARLREGVGEGWILMQSNVRQQSTTGGGMRQHRPDELCSELTDSVERIAQTTCTVLLTGETGVGKGHAARWMHDHGPRADRPFIPVNCGAIPEHLIDSQLFGHVRGAFTGADRPHEGLIGAAVGGTLLLDEVSELPKSAQVRLLRVLEEREVQPVGSPQPVAVDVRIIAATNRDLQQCVEDGSFREDLYYRLNVIELRVPPLRERQSEIDALVDRFNTEFAQLYDQLPVTIDDSARQVLRVYDWPGNVRELRIVIERLHVLCPHDLATPAVLERYGQLSLRRGAGSSGSILVELKSDQALSQRMREARIEAVRQTVAACGGNVASAARCIGVHRSTLYRWLSAS